ncbi:hypothetical protein EC973_000239 [Apophysomyces ossiformis]|uniref:Uncharacterized protein n=1 Tax=Apophysomyces ossiformis TaxID=679940 RepID=A0A8H7BYB4_9FUNG|nr:hypothetical protein EC973_000239 [Apophysomyces ossiformis]
MFLCRASHHLLRSKPLANPFATAGRSYYSSHRDNNDNNSNKKDKYLRKPSFMPVINIPETEFAHNAFFSLHRPLLGLQTDHERPFFSNADEQVDDDLMLADENVLLEYITEPDGFTAPMQQRIIEPIQHEHHQQHPPVYYMPKENQLIDYLTAIEEKMRRQQTRGRKRFYMTSAMAKRQGNANYHYRQPRLHTIKKK